MLGHIKYYIYYLKKVFHWIHKNMWKLLNEKKHSIKGRNIWEKYHWIGKINTQEHVKISSNLKEICLRIHKNTKKCNINAKKCSRYITRIPKIYRGPYLAVYYCVLLYFFIRVEKTKRRSRIHVCLTRKYTWYYWKHIQEKLTQYFLNKFIISFSQLVIYHELGVINFDLSFLFFTVGR